MANTAFRISKENFDQKNIVFLEGNIYSRSIIIGEALGAQEVLLKRIFIGKSGLLLRRIINIKVPKNRYLLINTVPWRPENNMTPSKHTISKYEYLWANLINGLSIENIICIGKIAEKMINNIIYSLKTTNILYTYHPSFYLRTSNRQVLEHIETTLEKFASRILTDTLISYTVIKSY